jgi:hypothetical protein
MANFKCQKMKVFEGVERKLLRPKFNLESSNHLYMNLALYKIFYSRALDSFSIINFKSQKIKGSNTVGFEGSETKLFSR